MCNFLYGGPSCDKNFFSIEVVSVHLIEINDLLTYNRTIFSLHKLRWAARYVGETRIKQHNTIKYFPTIHCSFIVENVNLSNQFHDKKNILANNLKVNFF